LSLDTNRAEERLRLEPVDDATPQVVFERQWVAAALRRCLEVLRDEQRSSGGADRFERLKSFLVGDGASADYSEAARDLRIPEATVRVAVHRLRKRFGAVLREEVARTVADPVDVEPEIRWMLSIVRDGG
jgi:RNA polymerase sigma-70 factor (ECF subfamily)